MYIVFLLYVLVENAKMSVVKNIIFQNFFFIRIKIIWKYNKYIYFFLWISLIDVFYKS